MLQSYCIQGFKSIKNATEVDLKKTQYQTLEKTNVCNGILKGCMFVGANASGKTNLIEPLRFLLMALFAVREMKWKNFLCLFSDADMFVIPGGMPGTKYLEEYKPLTELLTDFYQNGGKVAAICAAPGIFERLGFLKGRNATSYPSVMEQLKSARTSLEPVVVDGNVTTSRGLGTAIDFSLSLIGQLEGSAKAEEIAESVVYVRA